MAGYFMSILISSFDYFLFCFAFGSLFLLIEFGNLSLHYSAVLLCFCEATRSGNKQVSIDKTITT